MIFNYRKAADKILGILFPRICPVCGMILTRENVREDINPYICAKCYAVLEFPRDPRCIRCSRPIHDEMQEYCRNCSDEKKNFDQGTALLMHDEPARKIIYDLKFSNKRDNADMLAYEAAHRLFRQIKFWDPDLIIPVPLYRRKERERGFNQASVLAVKLSRFLEEKGLSIPVRDDILERVRQTKPMKTLDSSERRRNIQGAFRLSDRISGSDIKNAGILLADDIYTSGATLSECAGVLKQAGAKKVYFLTFSIG